MSGFEATVTWSVDHFTLVFIDVPIALLNFIKLELASRVSRRAVNEFTMKCLFTSWLLTTKSFRIPDELYYCHEADS